MNSVKILQLPVVNRITVDPVREHMEQVVWARLEALIEKK